MFDENEIRQLNEKQLAELIEYHNRKYWAEAERKSRTTIRLSDAASGGT